MVVAVTSYGMACVPFAEIGTVAGTSLKQLSISKYPIWLRSKGQLLPTEFLHGKRDQFVPKEDLVVYFPTNGACLELSANI
jgi:hypothetical protein